MGSQRMSRCAPFVTLVAVVTVANADDLGDAVQMLNEDNLDPPAALTDAKVSTEKTGVKNIDAGVKKKVTTLHTTTEKTVEELKAENKKKMDERQKANDKKVKDLVKNMDKETTNIMKGAKEKKKALDKNKKDV